MARFGAILRRLRNERRLTQADLARMAEVSEPTIGRAERSDRCILRRNTARRVLYALNEIASIDAEGMREYLQQAGFPPTIARRAAGGLASPAPGPGPTHALPGQDPAAIARKLLEAMLERAGGERVLPVLKGIAGAFNVHVSAPDEHGAMFVYHSEPRVVEDRIVTIHQAVPAPPVKGKPQAKRKTAT